MVIFHSYVSLPEGHYFLAKKQNVYFNQQDWSSKTKVEGGLIEPQNVLWHYDPWPFLPRADTSGPKLSQIYMAMGTMGQNPGTSWTAK